MGGLSGLANSAWLAPGCGAAIGSGVPMSMGGGGCRQGQLREGAVHSASRQLQPKPGLAGAAWSLCPSAGRQVLQGAAHCADRQGYAGCTLLGCTLLACIGGMQQELHQGPDCESVAWQGGKPASQALQISQAANAATEQRCQGAGRPASHHCATGSAGKP